MKKTWNQYVVKKQNQSLVLDVIRKEFPISRADISNITGLNKGTVSSLVTDLINKELIYESGPGKSSGGRRPVMLLFNKLAGFSIGIDLGVNYLLGVLTDLEGNIYNEEYVELRQLRDHELINHLFHMIDSLINKAPDSPYGIIGMGIGVPGIVNKYGKVLLAPNLGWKDVDLKKLLKEKYQIPIVIENEANMGAYGEKKLGVGKASKNIIYVSIGIGIGVGLILNGELYKGNNGFSGEIGHMTINYNGDRCRCGNVGCWELYASEQALIKKAKHLGINHTTKEELSLDTLLSLAEEGNEKIINLFQEIGSHIAIGLNNIINTFNPEQIIIGNRITSAEQWIREPLKNKIRDQAMHFNQKDLSIDFAKLTSHSAALGAVSFTIENFFELAK
ncbi:MAG TPA: ROK family transcriptional regulator [Candidatus Avamphibacillus sp.]|nr:ROK family transcriptional regulator [Candidatus Avamphibacillus sp.]